LAAVIASRTEDYLLASSRTIQAAAEVYSSNLVERDKTRQYLDTLLASSQDLTSITFTDANGRISVIGLPKNQAHLQEELTGIDLSLTNAVAQVRSSGKPAWSDAYLSPVGGGLTVAYATPTALGTALGEISLDRLSGFLKGVSPHRHESIFIIDRRGQVIADQEGRYTARQYNLTDLDIVREGLGSGRPVTRNFSFNGSRVVGCLIPAPVLDWNILVLSPLNMAYRSALTTTGIFSTALGLALFAASGLALLMSQAFARRFERLVAHSHLIESGEQGGEWPKSQVREFRLLGQALQSMADSLQERETRLNAQLHFLQQLIDSIPIPVFYKNISGNYLGCNTAFETMVGRPRGEIIGKNVYDLAPKERADEHHAADAALLREPGVRTYETIGTFSDGEIRYLILTKATFFDADNRIAGTVGAIIDITSRRKAEEERNAFETQLHQAQKMEAIGQLAGGIAHDFNNILTAILGYTDIVRSRMGKTSPSREYLDVVMAAAERAAELTSGLLAFSRKQLLLIKPVDLREVLSGMEKILRGLLPEDIVFEIRSTETELTVMADRGQIEQVLLNLVMNAKDAMPNGGAISIEAGCVSMPEPFTHAHGSGRPGNYACVSVADTGHGMNESTRKKIFEPFFTTKEVGKGTGLGMSIVYGILQQHHGYISVHSEENVGSRFDFYLPLAHEEAMESHLMRQPTLPSGGSETILLAEDDVTVRKLNAVVLETAGYNVIEAVDGEDALEKFMEHRADVDLLATDVVMPNMDGKRLYDEIRKVRPDIKALFMSGYTKDIILEKGIFDGEFSYIAKPVRPGELLELVRDILDERCV
jgi:PAS domain S-box-containing protein